METAKHWRLKSQRYTLVGEECDNCGTKLFPPRDVCVECAAPAKELYTFTGLGEIYSYTTIYDAPAGFESYAPYTVALVKLDEGPLVTAQLTDCDEQEISVGTTVEMVTRKIRVCPCPSRWAIVSRGCSYGGSQSTPCAPKLTGFTMFGL
jgi:uncharacterized OB-fold protein